MALEWGTFGEGASVFPLTSSTANSLLKDADPAIFYCLDFFAFVLGAYMGTRLVAEATACGAPITAAVAYTLPDDPATYLTQAQVAFPLLAIHRVQDVVTDRTLTYREAKGTWRVHYVLPPIDAGQRERLLPALRAAARIIDNRIEAKFDPNYLGGARIFGPGYANLESIRLMTVDYAEWETGSPLSFPAAAMTLEVCERDTVIAGAFDALAGTDTALDLKEPPAATLADVVDIATDLTP